MGLIYWLYGRSLDPTLRFIEAKFAKKPVIVEANTNALKAGWNYGETTDAFVSSFRVDKAKLPAGTYRNMMGNEALAMGLLTAAKLSDKDRKEVNANMRKADQLNVARHKTISFRSTSVTSLGGGRYRVEGKSEEASFHLGLFDTPEVAELAFGAGERADPPAGAIDATTDDHLDLDNNHFYVVKDTNPYLVVASTTLGETDPSQTLPA